MLLIKNLLRSKGNIDMKQDKVRKLEDKINKDYNNITGVIVLKDGKIQYENYFNGCSRESTIHIYSVTKSIVSILIGIAIDKGYIKSVDQKVLDFFPNYIVKKREKSIQNITLKNLINMTAPYKYIIPPYIKYFTSNDMVNFSLNYLGGLGKIGKFKYTPLIGPDILSGILANVTGQSVLDFARENLFTPLGINIYGNIRFNSKEEQLAFNNATNISGWVVDSCGINTAGWGLTLSSMDMAKIGKLYLDGGIYNGKQIVSRKWIEESTTEHSRWKKLNLPYGYLWWINNDIEDGFAAMGDGGNVIYVNKDRNIVVAITSLFKRNVTDRIDFIKNYIEPIFE